MALDFLRANLGVGEHPPGSNHNFLTEWGGVGDVAWCAITVSRALNEAWGNPDIWQVPGVASTYSWGTAYVPSLRVFFIEAGLFDEEPRVGDVIIYGWSAGSDGDHTGLVEQVVGDGTIVALEGNQTNDLVRIRRSPDVIIGYGHPPYGGAGVASAPDREDLLMGLSDAEQKDLYGTVKALSHTTDRLEQLLVSGLQVVDLHGTVEAISNTLDRIELLLRDRQP